MLTALTIGTELFFAGLQEKWRRKMLTSNRVTLRRPGKAILALTLLVCGAGAGSVMAYRHYFRRPGEQAIAQIPADALLVVTLDTNPGPDQVLLFKRIQDAVKTSGLNANLDEIMKQMAAPPPADKDDEDEDAPAKPGAPAAPAAPVKADDPGALYRETRPFLKDNYAFALFKKPSGNMDAVGFVAINDRAKVLEILNKDCEKKKFGTMSYFAMPNAGMCAALRNDYLLLSDAPQAFQWADGVRMNRARSVDSLPEYQQARAALPADASLMVFASPTALREVNHQIQTASARNTPAYNLEAHGTKWAALSLTLRDTGVAFDYALPEDASTMDALKTLANIAPVSPDVLKQLPAGAYGVMTYSQPGKYYDVFTQAVSEDKKTDKEVKKSLAEFRKETGMDIVSDIVPAFGGAVTLAVYPDANNPNGAADGVVLISDTNGADPATLTAKVRTLVEKESGKKNKADTIRFIPKQHDGVTYWYLDTPSEQRLSESLNGMAGSPSTRRTLQRGIAFNDVDEEDDGTDPTVYVKDKTIAYAQVGKSVLFASSKKMLEEAVTTYTGHEGSLADDPGFAAMQKAMMPGAQNFVMIHVGHIMERIRPEIARALKDDDTGIAADIVDMFGSPDAGILIASRYDGKIASGTILLPLNYEKMLQVVSKAAKKTGTPHDNRLTMRTGAFRRCAAFVKRHGQSAW